MSLIAYSIYILILQLLGTEEIFVVHHSDCGMLLFNDQIIGDLLANDLETASIDLNTGVWSPSVPFFKGSSEGKFIKWHTFTDLEVLYNLCFLWLLLRQSFFAAKCCWWCEAHSWPSPYPWAYSYLWLLLRCEKWSTSASTSSYWSRKSSIIRRPDW